MRVGVTGATGFIGKSISRHLLRAGHEVIALVRNTAACLAILAEVEARPLDLSGKFDPSVLEGIDVVCHAAAHKPIAMADAVSAEICLRVNSIGTLALVEAARAANVHSFVYLSAGNAYVPQGRPARESDPVFPVGRATYYLTSKVCGELFALHATKNALDCVSLRISAVFGPEMGSTGLFPNTAVKLRAREQVILADNGRYAADFVYVDDVCAAVAAAIDTGATGIFNIGSGELRTVRDVAQALAIELGADPSLVVLGARDENAPPSFAALDITKARRELGFRPRPFREGLKAYLVGANMAHERDLTLL